MGKTVGLTLLVAATLQFAAQAIAQTYPSRPLRLICPSAPAGAVDIAARLFAFELQKVLGQPISVENRPGAGGNVGAEAAARAAPDGYTLFLTTSGIQAINPALYSKLGFDPNGDLAPVAPLVLLNNVLVLRPTLRVASVRDLIGDARAEPGRIAYASSGSGTSVHLSGELFKAMTGVDILHVPYKGSGPALSDLLGGRVDMMFDNIPSSLPYIKARKLKALATTGARRDPSLPELPTLGEAGLPGFESSVWFGLSVPAATPRNIVVHLNAEAIRAASAPAFDKRMRSLGYLPIAGTAEQMADMIRADIARWAPLVLASGARAD